MSLLLWTLIVSISIAYNKSPTKVTSFLRVDWEINSWVKQLEKSLTWSGFSKNKSGPYNTIQYNSTSLHAVIVMGVCRGGNQICVKMKAPTLWDPEQDKQIRKWLVGWMDDSIRRKDVNVLLWNLFESHAEIYFPSLQTGIKTCVVFYRMKKFSAVLAVASTSVQGAQTWL